MTDFTLIREGSLHRANGGYLVVPWRVLQNSFAWDSLKRGAPIARSGSRRSGERLGFMTTKGLRPEPIPLDVKVILIGRPNLYSLLYYYDEDFRKIFKVKVDFDTRMPMPSRTCRTTRPSSAPACARRALLHLDRSGVAEDHRARRPPGRGPE